MLHIRYMKHLEIQIKKNKTLYYCNMKKIYNKMIEIDFYLK